MYGPNCIYRMVEKGKHYEILKKEIINNTFAAYYRIAIQNMSSFKTGEHGVVLFPSFISENLDPRMSDDQISLQTCRISSARSLCVKQYSSD